MDPAPAQMFRLLGLHPGPDISAETAACLAGLTSTGARAALDELTKANLLAEPRPGRFSFHDLLRAYAAEQAAATDSQEARRAAVGRALDHYACAGWTAALLLNPVRLAPARLVSPAPGYVPADLADQAQALAWFEAEHKILVRAIAQAAQHGFDRQAWQISWSLADYQDRRGLWRDWVRVQHAAVAAATRLGDQRLQASAHRLLGRAYSELGRYPDARAHFEWAIGLYTLLGDRAGRAYTLLGLARVDEYLSQFGRALHRVEQSRGLFAALGDGAGEAKAINAVGWFHAHLGHYEEALAACHEALHLYELLGDRRGEASTLDSLGYIYHQLGDYPRALASYQSAVVVFQENDDRHNRAATLTRQGDSHEAAGDSRSARSVWQQALAILTDLRHPSAEQVRGRLSQPLAQMAD
jgi:tetratricopeptide (TPR) repeat protein